MLHWKYVIFDWDNLGAQKVELCTESTKKVKEKLAQRQT